MSAPSERWVRIKAVFDATVAVESSERAAYVIRACGDDEDLRREVEALLASHDRARTFLETAASDALNVPAAPDALIGRTAGTYQITARIGAGGLGEVYKAHDLKLNRPVALKLLRMLPAMSLALSLSQLCGAEMAETCSRDFEIPAAVHQPEHPRQP